MLVQNTLSSGSNSAGQVWGFRGSGISANYYPSVWTNANPCSMYMGCGGTLEPIRWKTFAGPYLELFNISSAPLNNGALVTVGCDSRGCDHTPPYRLFQLQNGTITYDPADGTVTVPRMAAGAFSGRLNGPLTTTQIELKDPDSPNQSLTITNSKGALHVSSHASGDGMGVSDSVATVIPGPANQGGNISCAKGYICTAVRGRLTLTAATTATTGTIATVKTMLLPGAICTAAQNGGSSFFGIGSGKESTTGFEITSDVALHGVVTIDYSCR